MLSRISNLKKSDALLRTNYGITNIQYYCYLNLTNNQNKRYNGLINIKFDIICKDNIFIDYSGEKIEDLIINNHKININEEFIKKNWINSYLYIPSEFIKNIDNNIDIKFSNYYSQDGDGLCLTYGADKLKYKYTQTEPYGLNRIYPAFDQPDLKGKVKYYFTVSEDDKIVTMENLEKNYNSNEEIFNNIDDNFTKKIRENCNDNLNNLWIFENSKLLSSYLYGFSIGPFVEFKLDIKNFNRGIPISIYCRKSMYKFMEKQIENIYFPMMKGIEIFEKFFGIDYPFTKNDLIFLPEYKIGAMEYPGCITINEDYIFQEEIVPPLRTLMRSHTIYHELAHMWFGNLVTMKWWDDLWLNESFAELISVMVMKQIKDPVNSIDYDTDMNLDLDWGLETDEKNSTHPINCDVKDTLMAESIFDGISYSKGPGILKQLIYNIGIDQFKVNLNNYFKKYKWSNTDLDMFLEEMGKNVNFNIDEFNKDFIQKPCLNKLITERTEDGINITQTYVLENFNFLRNHKINIVFFDKNFKIIKNMEAMIQKQINTFIQLDKVLLNESKAIFINYNFNAWVRFKLDFESNEFILNNMENFKKFALNFKFFINNYYNQVRDSETKSTDFLNKILNNFEIFVKDQALLTNILPLLYESIHIYMPENIKNENFNKLNHKILNYLIKEENPIITKKLFDYYLKTCKSSQSILSLKPILDNEFSNKNLKLVNKDKWEIYFKLMASGLLDQNFEKKYLEKLDKEDETDEKLNIKLKIDGFKSNSEGRKKLFEIYKNSKNSELNYHEKLISISGFKNELLDQNIRYDYYDNYFNSILDIYRKFGYENGENFLLSLNPQQYRLDENIMNFKKLLNNIGKDEDSFRLSLISVIDDLQRIKRHLNMFN